MGRHFSFEPVRRPTKGACFLPTVKSCEDLERTITLQHPIPPSPARVHRTG